MVMRTPSSLRIWTFSSESDELDSFALSVSLPFEDEDGVGFAKLLNCLIFSSTNDFDEARFELLLSLEESRTFAAAFGSPSFARNAAAVSSHDIPLSSRLLPRPRDRLLLRLRLYRGLRERERLLLRLPCSREVLRRLSRLEWLELRSYEYLSSRLLRFSELRARLRVSGLRLRLRLLGLRFRLFLSGLRVRLSLSGLRDRRRFRWGDADFLLSCGLEEDEEGFFSGDGDRFLDWVLDELQITRYL